MSKYSRSPIPAPYNKQPMDKKQYYEAKAYSSRYPEKAHHFEDKRDYNRREQSYPEKKIRYDDRREDRGEPYSVEGRKPHSSYPQHHDSRPQHSSRPKQAMYHHESRPGDIRGPESRPTEWQTDRIKKHKDPAPTYRSGVQSVSPWRGNEGSKMRVESRDPQYRDREQAMPHSGDRRYRQQNEPRDMQDRRPDSSEVRGSRADVRDLHVIRGAPRKPQVKKWAPERVSYEREDTRRSGGAGYGDNRNRSHEGSAAYSEERRSPAFYREVRRSGENRRHDLGIEITIHDDGRRTNVDFDKNRSAVDVFPY